MSRDDGPGVPEAVPRVVRSLGERIDPGTMDRLWVFPPMRKGRWESGLVAASTYSGPGPTDPDGEGPEEERRLLVVAPYTAERTGKGLFLEVRYVEQGEAPPDRLPRVMDGVVRRAGDDLGDPREIEIEGDPERFRDYLGSFDPALFEEELQGTAS